MSRSRRIMSAKPLAPRAGRAAAGGECAKKDPRGLHITLNSPGARGLAVISQSGPSVFQRGPSASEARGLVLATGVDIRDRWGLRISRADAGRRVGLAAMLVAHRNSCSCLCV